MAIRIPKFCFWIRNLGLFFPQGAIGPLACPWGYQLPDKLRRKSSTSRFLLLRAYSAGEKGMAESA